MSDSQGYDPYVHDPHGAVGAYVADALDDDERTVFEQHLEGCESCRREVAEFTETAAELTWLSEATPPPSLRTSVLWQIATVRPLPPEQPLETPGSPVVAGLVDDPRGVDAGESRQPAGDRGPAGAGPRSDRRSSAAGRARGAAATAYPPDADRTGRRGPRPGRRTGWLGVRAPRQPAEPAGGHPAGQRAADRPGRQGVRDHDERRTRLLRGLEGAGPGAVPG